MKKIFLIGFVVVFSICFASYVSAPIGVVQMFAGTTAPDGWLICDGAAISRTTYAQLYAVIGTTYGTGDGSTTFNLPDFRNTFPRGANSSARTIGSISYPALALGSVQNDKIQGHKHTITHGHTGAYSWGVSTGSTGYVGSSYQTSGINFTPPITINNFTGDSTVPVTDSSNGTPRTGTTTEPQALGINFIIKY